MPYAVFKKNQKHARYVYMQLLKIRLIMHSVQLNEVINVKL